MHACMHMCACTPAQEAREDGDRHALVVAVSRSVAPRRGGLTGLDVAGLDWTGLDVAGLDWTGLDWTGLGWAGLDWAGLKGIFESSGWSGRRPHPRRHVALVCGGRVGRRGGHCRLLLLLGLACLDLT